MRGRLISPEGAPSLAPFPSSMGPGLYPRATSTLRGRVDPVRGAIDERQEELRESRDELSYLKETLVHLEGELEQVVSSQKVGRKIFLMSLKGIYSSLKDIDIAASRSLGRLLALQLAPGDAVTTTAHTESPLFLLQRKNESLLERRKWVINTRLQWMLESVNYFTNYLMNSKYPHIHYPSLDIERQVKIVIGKEGDAEAKIAAIGSAVSFYPILNAISRSIDAIYSAIQGMEISAYRSLEISVLPFEASVNVSAGKVLAQFDADLQKIDTLRDVIVCQLKEFERQMELPKTHECLTTPGSILDVFWRVTKVMAIDRSIKDLDLVVRKALESPPPSDQIELPEATSSTDAHSQIDMYFQEIAVLVHVIGRRFIELESKNRIEMQKKVAAESRVIEQDKTLTGDNWCPYFVYKKFSQFLGKPYTPEVYPRTVLTEKMRALIPLVDKRTTAEEVATQAQRTKERGQRLELEDWRRRSEEERMRYLALQDKINLIVKRKEGKKGISYGPY
jgi:hypothetical protein